MGWHDMDGWNWVWMMAMMLIFWGGVAALAVFGFGRRGGSSNPSLPPSAEETLQQRFARGEIDADEYHDRLATLKGSHR